MLAMDHLWFSNKTSANLRNGRQNTSKVDKVSRRKKFGNIIFVMKGGEVDYRDIIYNALVPQGQTENTELNLGFFINIPKKRADNDRIIVNALNTLVGNIM